MKKIFLYLCIILLAGFSFSGCGVAKVYNVNEVINSKKELFQIEKDIIKAGKSLGWDMKKHQDGYIIGTIILRTHTAKVKITYTETTYKIDYISSVNLEYNPAEDTIKSNYNGWINNLKNTINNYLVDLSMTKELLVKEAQSNKDKISSDPIVEGKTKIKDITKTFTEKDNIDSVTKAIIESGNSLGWNMKIQEEGIILGRIALRDHLAIIKITYTKNSYNITYITSENLDYTSDYTIHRNYNGWITNLSNSINMNLNMF